MERVIALLFILMVAGVGAYGVYQYKQGVSLATDSKFKDDEKEASAFQDEEVH